MTVQQISQIVANVIKAIRVPLVKIPNVILACSLIKRPGLSAIMTASNIISRQGEAGVPVGRMPDGSANAYEAMEAIRVQEIYKSLKFDSRIDSTIPIAGIQITAFGANAGGPIVVQGFNTNNPTSQGIIR